MRRAIYVAAACALALWQPETTRMLLASAASVLFEATPYLVGTALLARIARRALWLLPYAGCGCGGGPSARSIPATLATAAIFGPWIALARFAAAASAAHTVVRRHGHDEEETILGALVRLVPSAAMAAAAALVLPVLHVGALPNLVQFVCGAAFGFVASPCALGAAAIGAAVRAHSAYAAFGFLCVAGIVDVQTIFGSHRHEHNMDRDAIAYAVLAFASGLLAYEHGAALVHPHIAIALAAASAALPFQARPSSGGGHPARLVVALMLFAVVAGAPQPEYVASETTLTDAFAGEHVDFTGVLARSAASATLVRYAITCCRADAQPVMLALRVPPPFPNHTWLHATGILERSKGELVLRADYLEPVAPPSDPFTYR